MKQKQKTMVFPQLYKTKCNLKVKEFSSKYTLKEESYESKMASLTSYHLKFLFTVNDSM